MNGFRRVDGSILASVLAFFAFWIEDIYEHCRFRIDKYAIMSYIASAVDSYQPFLYGPRSGDPPTLTGDIAVRGRQKM